MQLWWRLNYLMITRWHIAAKRGQEECSWARRAVWKLTVRSSVVEIQNNQLKNEHWASMRKYDFSFHVGVAGQIAAVNTTVCTCRTLCFLPSPRLFSRCIFITCTDYLNNRSLELNSVTALTQSSHPESSTWVLILVQAKFTVTKSQ